MPVAREVQDADRQGLQQCVVALERVRLGVLRPVGLKAICVDLRLSAHFGGNQLAPLGDPPCSSTKCPGAWRGPDRASPRPAGGRWKSSPPVSATFGPGGGAPGSPRASFAARKSRLSIIAEVRLRMVDLRAVARPPGRMDVMLGIGRRLIAHQLERVGRRSMSVWPSAVRRSSSRI